MALAEVTWPDSEVTVLLHNSGQKVNQAKNPPTTSALAASPLYKQEEERSGQENFASPSPVLVPASVLLAFSNSETTQHL